MDRQTNGWMNRRPTGDQKGSGELKTQNMYIFKKWTLIYPDARYLDASASRRFFLGKKFSLNDQQFCVPNPDGLWSIFTTECIVKLNLSEQ